ncbi:MAG: metallophosphoesterase [Clostridia bacterium]
MAIYGISDVHLSLSENKSMEVFGPVWHNYVEKIKENWIKVIKDEDTVIIAGDISWANKLEEAYEDFKYLDSLPGKKIILKGNHDFFFTTKTKIDNFLKENNFNTIEVLHNNSYEACGYIIAGTRGWGKVDNEAENLDNDKIYAREAIRLELSIKDGIQKFGEDKKIIVVMHFPPFQKPFQEVLSMYKDKIEVCIYGHLHGAGHFSIKEGIIEDINYKMVSVDYTDFTPIKLTN